MAERPKIYHGHYVIQLGPGKTVMGFCTLKHPLDLVLPADSVRLNWLPISGLKVDWDRWGYPWDEGVQP
jgi:hypothetical protein